VSDEHDDDPASPRWAADEPTAMWDDSLMRDAGYTDLAKDRSEKPRGESGPATERGVGGDEAARVRVSPELTGGHPAVSAPPAKKPPGLSWVITVVLAVGLGVAVYVAIRLLR
jgi:hypothetical protein